MDTVKEKNDTITENKAKILFICHGNVGRSQMAEAFYNHFTRSKNASSAGVDPTTPKRYAHPTEEIIQVMKEENIDVSEKKIKTVTNEMVKNCDLVFIMCKKGDCPDFLLDHNNITFWNVEDPFEAGKEATRKIRDIIKSRVLSIIRKLESNK